MDLGKRPDNNLAPKVGVTAPTPHGEQLRMNTAPMFDETEEFRLGVLDRLGLLDSPTEKDFDEIVELAASLCGTPIALVSLVGRDRQYFKAHYGVEADSTPREQSVCAHTMKSNAVLEIPDTRTDMRTRDNPLVDDEAVRMRFYAGAPLVTQDGVPLGALCVIDHETRVLTETQRQALQVLARQVMAQIELRNALKQSTETADALRDALDREEILRREIDHRVKNSLQQVTSLLRMQASRSSSDEVRQELQEASGRVAAITQLHDLLHQSGRGSSVDISAYFDRLCDKLRTTARDGVTIESQVPVLHLSSSHASALAMIANEFVANSLKHAFPDDRPGRIHLTLSAEGPELVARFSDDGIGQAGDEAGRAPGLGRRIIEAAASQIGSVLDYLEGPGTRLEFRFSPQAAA
ncbi:GAF domain-containing protein [Aquicoccus sp. SCR17]|nr:GAF domain-containing protein [Carideicomes alvinocaridis]